MTLRKLLTILPAAALLAGCTPKQTAPTESSVSVTPAGPVKRPIAMPGTGIIQSQIPKATAFKMSGDYENNVAITLAASATLLYYPAPTDLSAASCPLKLEGGWWLNRQGISANSVFTTYTFAEYAALPSVPTQKQLIDSIIPGAKVTEFVTLPYTINDASSHIEEINLYLNNL